MVTKGFGGGRRPPHDESRIPPGQSVTDGFPVMTASFTPDIRTEKWTFTLKHGPRPVKTWDWQAFNALPQTTWKGDIHCVTHWTKLDTVWEGVTIDALLTDAAPDAARELAGVKASSNWGWWVAGGVAVAGGATAAVLLLNKSSDATPAAAPEKISLQVKLP